MSVNTAAVKEVLDLICSHSLYLIIEMHILLMLY